MNGSFGGSDASGAAGANGADGAGASGWAPDGVDAPDADVHVDEALASRLVAEQHPELRAPVRLVANGWDNAILRLGESLAIRMPRRRLAAGLIENELRWLPELGRRSPVPLPVPVRRGRPSGGYPFDWSITPWFEGRPALEVDPAARSGMATALAGFIASLQLAAPSDAPRNPYRGVPLAQREAVVAPRLDDVRLRRLADPAVLRRVWRDALAAPAWAGAPVWVHGDLHPGNLVLEASDGPDGAFALAAVLDFGDLSAGDPATDLAAAWLCFDAEGRARLRGALDELGTGFVEADWVRARGWALAIASSIALTVGVDGPIGRVGAHALAHLAAD